MFTINIQKTRYAKYTTFNATHYPFEQADS